jgi:hypothetical protein
MVLRFPYDSANCIRFKGYALSSVIRSEHPYPDLSNLFISGGNGLQVNINSCLSMTHKQEARNRKLIAYLTNTAARDSNQIIRHWGSRFETVATPPFLPNPPKADKSLRLPREMRRLFLWGQAQILILKILYVFLWLKFLPSPPGRRPYRPEA